MSEENKSTVWVLTEEYNAYDQYGEYFLKAFKNKPTKEQLLDSRVHPWDVEHVLNGGGRVKYENQWYNLNEIELESGIK